MSPLSKHASNTNTMIASSSVEYTLGFWRGKKFFSHRFGNLFSRTFFDLNKKRPNRFSLYRDYRLLIRYNISKTCVLQKQSNAFFDEKYQRSSRPVPHNNNIMIPMPAYRYNIPIWCPVRWPLVLVVYRGSFNGLAGISFIFSPQFYYSINLRDRVCADGARRRLFFGGGGPAHVLQRRAVSGLCVRA